MEELPTQLSDASDRSGRESPVSGACDRYLLWIDGVGGFLVCLSPRVLLGHAALGSDVGVPILADISRQHAWVQRDPEGCFLEALRAVRINQLPVTKSLLRSGDQITLGKSCQLIFTQAVPVSASARLDLVSGHRFGRALQGVLLMAETLVLGPGSATHVQIPDLPQSMILFRQGKGLAVRYPGKLRANGETCTERCSFAPGAKVVVEDVALSLERIDG